MPAVPPIPLHVGFVCSEDAENPAALSGAPYRMLKALAERFERVSIWSRAPRAPGPPPPASFPARIARALRRTLTPAPAVHWALYGGAMARAVLDRAERDSRSVNAWAGRVRPDVIFGCYASPSLYRHEFSAPVVYCSDSTARLLTATYPEFAALGPRFAEVQDRLERAALARADLAVVASEAAFASAVHDYHRSPARTAVVPLGANIAPAEPPPLPAPPARADELRLWIAAVQPRRKRLDLAVEATELLRRWGFAAVLNVIGRTTRRARRSPVVREHGVLSLADPRHRRRMESLIGGSHWLILPSCAEAYGIAPCDSAHFGRPSIVSDAGGLPTVVLDGITGLVLPVSAPAEAYARAIANMTDDPAAYRALSAAALERARAVLNWRAWGDRVAGLVTAALSPAPAIPAPVLAGSD